MAPRADYPGSLAKLAAVFVLSRVYVREGAWETCPPRLVLSLEDNASLKNRLALASSEVGLESVAPCLTAI